MDYFWAAGGGFLLGWVACISIFLAMLQKTKKPKLIGADLPQLNSTIDLSKRYNIVHGSRYGREPAEIIAGARILGYIRSDRDATGGEYVGGTWLVVEMGDSRKVYIRPREIHSLEEAPGT